MIKVGIIGGGQLGMMLIDELHKLGAQTICLDPSEDAPAFATSDECVVGEFDDVKALEYLCSQSDVVTYEFENISGDLLVELEQRYNIKQGFKPLYDSQDRLREKLNAREHGLQTPQFEAVDSEKSLRAAVAGLGLPCVLKTRRFGYDGHGQMVLRTEKDIADAVKMLDVPCIAEQFVDFDFETSVIMVADADQVVVFPLGQNIHKGGILDLCVVGAPMNEVLRAKIEMQSRRFMLSCGYRGILAIEYFVKGDQIYFNEMAPRPHNSGHYSIEGCSTNQFRELARYLLGLPLETPRLLAPTIMKNILGEDMEVAQCIADNNIENCYVHLYGKKGCKPKRKMGHITFVGMTMEEYQSKWKDKFVK